MSSSLDCQFIIPDWPAPRAVQALVTTRQGGPSQGPYAAFNLGDHVGDDPCRVAECRRQLAEHAAGTHFLWLTQVHGTRVAGPEEDMGSEADAAFSRQPGTGCVVMTADCLPILLCDRAGRSIGAVHAGWRGLLAGVVESTLAALAVAPDQLMAWLGPAIGPCCFEVGAEVRNAFCAHLPQATEAFRLSPHRFDSPRYLADIYTLARQRLALAGVTAVYGGEYCTCCEAKRFYSYRRDGAPTGRMATAIWWQ